MRRALALKRRLRVAGLLDIRQGRLGVEGDAAWAVGREGPVTQTVSGLTSTSLQAIQSVLLAPRNQACNQRKLGKPQFMCLSAL